MRRDQAILGTNIVSPENVSLGVADGQSLHGAVSPPTLRLGLTRPSLLPLLLMVMAWTGCSHHDAPAGVETRPGPNLAATTEIAPGVVTAVFDGRTDPGFAYFIGAFNTAKPRNGMHSVVLRPGVFIVPPSFVPDFRVTLGPPTPPIVYNACQALDQSGAIDQFLDAAAGFAEDAASHTQACAADVQTLVGEIKDLVQRGVDEGNVRTEEGGDSEGSSVENQLGDCYFRVDQNAIIRFGEEGFGGSWPEIDGEGLGCMDCSESLSDVSDGLEALSQYVSQCVHVRGRLEAIRDRVLEELEGEGLSEDALCWGNPTAPGGDPARGSSDDVSGYLILAEDLEGKAASTRAITMERVNAELCSQTNLEKGCEACPVGSRDRVHATAAVFEVPAGPAIGHIVGALRRAANLSDDAADAAAFAELAARLASTPRKPIRRVVFPAPLTASRDFIALRSSLTSGLPEVLILTAVPNHLLPPPTLRDEIRWFEETATWRQMFGQGFIELP